MLVPGKALLLLLLRLAARCSDLLTCGKTVSSSSMQLTAIAGSSPEKSHSDNSSSISNLLDHSCWNHDSVCRAVCRYCERPC